MVDPGSGLTVHPGRWIVLRYPEFGRIWFGYGLSTLGTHLSVLALPLLVLDITGSAVMAGLVGTLRLLAYTAANLPAGALADRLPRRALLIVADVTRSVFVLAIGVSILNGGVLPIAVLILLGVGDTVVSAVAGPAGMAATRHLVPGEEIASALGSVSARGILVGLAGPLLGGVLYQVAPALPFLVDAASYAISTAMVLSVGRWLGGGAAGASTLASDIRAGLRTVLRSRFIMLFLSWAALTNFATAGITFGLVLVIGPANGARLGTAMAVLSLGGLLGSVLAPRLTRVDSTTLVRAVSALTVLLALLITVHPVPLVVTAGAAGICLLGPVVAIPLNARLFAVVPDHMMGRVQSSVFLVGGSLYPFAMLASGWLTERFSFPVAFGTFTALLGVVLVLTLLPGLRLDPIARESTDSRRSVPAA